MDQSDECLQLSAQTSRRKKKEEKLASFSLGTDTDYIFCTQFLTKQTARSHTLHELCKALDASEAGVKNAMSRRKIEKCKDYVKKGKRAVGARPDRT